MLQEKINNLHFLFALNIQKSIYERFTLLFLYKLIIIFSLTSAFVTVLFFFLINNFNKIWFIHLYTIFEFVRFTFLLVNLILKNNQRLYYFYYIDLAFLCFYIFLFFISSFILVFYYEYYIERLYYQGFNAVLFNWILYNKTIICVSLWICYIIISLYKLNFNFLLFCYLKNIKLQILSTNELDNLELSDFQNRLIL